MPYKLVSTHDDKKTLKQISEKAGIVYQKGKGYYLITEIESVSSSKELVLFENGKYVTDNGANIRVRLSLPATGDIDIDPGNLSSSQQLFVQSTSPNRKISASVPVLYYIEGDDDNEEEEEETKTSTNHNTTTTTTTTATTTSPIKYAINYDLLLSDSLEEIDDDFTQFFNIPIGSEFNDCDRVVPAEFQKPSIWYLSNITRTEWSDVDIHQEKLPYTTYNSVTRVTAIGKLSLFPTNPFLPFQEYPVRLEYFWKEEWSCYAISIGMLWGAMFGSCGEHPFVVTPEINYGNSDGSSSDYPPIAICECIEKETFKGISTPSSPFSEYQQITINQKMDAICGHLMRIFSNHCHDLEH